MKALCSSSLLSYLTKKKKKKRRTGLNVFMLTVPSEACRENITLTEVKEILVTDPTQLV